MIRLRGSKPYSSASEPPQNRRPEGSQPLPDDTTVMAAIQSADDDNGILLLNLERVQPQISREGNKRHSFGNVSSPGKLSVCVSASSPYLLLSAGFALGCFCCVMLNSWSFWKERASSWRRNANGCLISFGAYRGHEYSTTETVRSTCLVESKFVKIQQHAVQFATSSEVIPDWLWIDYHERINVLVQASDDLSGGHRFHVLEQTKYALQGRTSRALVGGITEPGEDPRDAARREVREELRLDCGLFVFLGRFRTDVNRGMGWTNGFLARDCSPDHTTHGDSSADEPNEQVGGADTERQDIKTISLSELRRSVVHGEFIEIQWTAIVGLALLHMGNELQ